MYQVVLTLKDLPTQKAADYLAEFIRQEWSEEGAEPRHVEIKVEEQPDARSSG